MTERAPRIGDAVTYCRQLRNYLWIMPAQVVGFYGRSAGEPRPTVSLVYWDRWGLDNSSEKSWVWISRLLGGEQRAGVGWHEAVHVVHRDNWVGDVPEDFWIWPEEGPMTSIQALEPGTDWREGMRWALERDARQAGRAAGMRWVERPHGSAAGGSE